MWHVCDCFSRGCPLAAEEYSLMMKGEVVNVL